MTVLCKYLIMQVNKYEAELNEVKAKADLSYLADHPNPNVKKQLLAYIRSGRKYLGIR
jgi:hypothetical protein